MSHGIEKPIDEVYSIQGTEWHGLADHVEAITDDHAKRLFGHISEHPLTVSIDGEEIEMPEHKLLVADYRDVREDGKIIPLHVPKNSYGIIQNSEVWDTMKTSINDLDAKISCVGTLEGGKKFFISVELPDSNFTANGDKFYSNLNYIASHDGTTPVQIYDSMIRIVCMNTFRWSLEGAKGEVGFKVKHTKNSQLAGIGDLVNLIISGRSEVADVMALLAEYDADPTDALAYVAGYFAESGEVSEGIKLSTRSMNAAQAIADLSLNGQGNKGKTLYDVFNGFTEYYTSGNGTGFNADAATKIVKSELGAASDHKSRFLMKLIDADAREVMKELGKEKIILAL
jgi:Domain of unknown function (DUF932)